jgi:hypothetical protein
MRLIFGRQAWPPHSPKRGWIIVYASILVSVLQGIALGAGLELYPTDFGTASGFGAGRLDCGLQSSWDDSTRPVTVDDHARRSSPLD